MSKSVEHSTHVFLDIDIHDSRQAYARCSEFVEKNSIKYGLSTSNLKLLGGGEKKRLQELYRNDYQWKDKGRIQLKPQKFTRLVIALELKASPLACKNFIHLCVGDKGKSKGGNILHYKHSKFHRIVPNLLLQGGDFVFGNGSGSDSIYDKRFKDDVKGLKLKHNKRGVVSMGNTGKNSNGSQFFITLGDSGMPACDKKHVVFGQVISGFEVLDLVGKTHQQAIEAGRTISGQQPAVDIVVTECGVFDPETMLTTGFWDTDNTFKPLPTKKKYS
jgi:cyclophilin family peptidyl-prolyl cis-trans isomerase